MNDQKPLNCPLCGNQKIEIAFVYHEPPQGEVRFNFSGGVYYREIYCCATCGHFLSVHAMDTSVLYEDEYVQSTYGGDGGIRSAFERIIALDPAKSDNHGRVQRILEFVRTHLTTPALEKRIPTVLDVGSGLCVFLYKMKAAGWDCTALDPDLRNVRHARQMVGVHAVDADFMLAKDLGRFDLIAFNKVLEHIQDPIAMLAKSRENLRDAGIVYVEVPDGECAVAEGPGREEFFIEHYHVFSLASLALLAHRAGFVPLLIERLREASTKYTIRAFLVPTIGSHSSADRVI
jgi:SAM-dependent methyltransferase